MAGRGRGGLRTFTQEQLQALGCLGKDMQQVLTVPPPTYPQIREIPKLQRTEDCKNKVSFRFENVYTINHSSACLVSPKEHLNEMPHSWMINNPEKTKVNMDNVWKMTPLELWSDDRKRQWKLNKYSKLKPMTKRIKKEVDVHQRLKVLEAKESEESIKQETTKIEPESEEENEFDDMQGDDEMDDDNDYGNNYFDNGESYNDEDDYLDDGPVY